MTLLQTVTMYFDANFVVAGNNQVITVSGIVDIPTRGSVYIRKVAFNDRVDFGGLYALDNFFLAFKDLYLPFLGVAFLILAYRAIVKATWM